MAGFEYKVVPAPMRGAKAKGVKGTPARFALALQNVMNEHGVEGWEYQRTDTLPAEERQGLTGKVTTFQNMLVFRRALDLPAIDAPPIAALIEDHSTPDEAAQAREGLDDLPAQDQTQGAAIEGAQDQNEPVALQSDDRVADAPAPATPLPWARRTDTTARDDKDKGPNAAAD